jgi:hypothetical protein
VFLAHGFALVAVFFVIEFEYLGPGIALFSVSLRHTDPDVHELFS